MIIGGPAGAARPEGRGRLRRPLRLPGGAAFRYQDYFDNRPRCYVGHAALGLDPKLAAAVKDADLLIVSARVSAR